MSSSFFILSCSRAPRLRKDVVRKHVYRGAQRPQRSGKPFPLVPSRCTAQPHSRRLPCAPRGYKRAVERKRVFRGEERACEQSDPRRDITPAFRLNADCFISSHQSRTGFTKRQSLSHFLSPIITRYLYLFCTTKKIIISFILLAMQSSIIKHSEEKMAVVTQRVSQGPY